MARASLKPYRKGVGIVLMDSRGHVFVGRRTDSKAAAWQMPQGGIDHGETPRAAALRELKEETGTDKAEIIGEMDDWITYDLPPHLIGVAFHGRFKGQRQKWFCLRFLGVDGDIDLAAHEPEFSTWRWVDLHDLPNLIVPFKRDTYKAVTAAFRGLAGKGA